MFLQTKEQIEFDYQSSIELAARRVAEAKTERAVRNMIMEGLSTKLICKVQEVTPEYVARIREAIKSEINLLPVQK